MSQLTKDEIDRKVDGHTITTRFLELVREHADRVALRERQPDGSWVEHTWADYAARVRGAAAYLQQLGVGPGDRVVLMMRNVPDFHFIDIAVLFCGGTAISIYNSSSPEQIAYLVGHCSAKVALVEDDGFHERFLKVAEELPALEHVVNLASDGVLDELYDGGAIDLDDAARACTPDDLATVIYTSGTTGPPKGVMISHYNVLFTAEGYLDLLQVDPVGFRAISYLPMAHIAERMSSHYLGVLGGLEVSTCPEPGQIATWAREVRPQTMFGVPRVWEKIHAGMQAALAANPDQQAKFDEAVEAAKPIAEARTLGTATDEQERTWEFLDEVAFRPARELLGLDQLKFAVTGAAPIPPELISWYRAIGVPMSEIYGMSESTGPITWEPYRVKAGTVGVAFPGCDVFLADDGEVCCRGGNVFVGYLDAPDKTAEALDPDGTLHTGDIGQIDDEGYLRIVDRKKELIITAGGKNISPANLEAALKMVPLVGQACAIGDKRPFVSALVVLDPETAPAWAKQHGITFSTVADLADDDRVREEIDRGVAELMASFNNAERVKKVTILADEWLPDSDELTPTSKLKRRGIHAKYSAEIEAMYS